MICHQLRRIALKASAQLACEQVPRKNLMRDLVIFICALGRLMETEL